MTNPILTHSKLYFVTIAVIALGGCSSDPFRVSTGASESLSETYVSAQYGAAGDRDYAEFRAGRVGCSDLARRGWSNADLFAIGCPAD